jgi:hypothetical protein
MSSDNQSRGVCSYCGQRMTKSEMGGHLANCAQRMEAIRVADQKPGEQEVLYHLLVEDAWSSDYWLHLEMDGSASLESLDSYLRAIWLECCDHLSEFFVGRRYGTEVPMEKRANRVFRKGTTLTHIYDFGTPSETRIRVIGHRRGRPLTKHPIALMARNDLPEMLCQECDQPAAWLCIECMYETDEGGLLCDKHAQNHPHESYGEPIPLPNSPRLGLCGYTGPADPPY